MKLYYYPVCSTCKKALKWLDGNEFKYEKENIVDANLTRKEIENIYKKLELGKSRYEAALEGVREISFSVLAISAMLLAIFIPIANMSGIVR